MNECFKCDISEEKVKLFEVISKKGIVKICKKCFSEENLPLIKNPNYSSPENFPELNKIKNLSNSRENSESKTPQKKPQTNETKSWLVNNFHWIIMRVRRSKHITQKQLAKAIDESETTIKEAERGIISKYNFQLINKIENYFRIKLTKIDNETSSSIEKTESSLENQSENIIAPNSKTTNNLTISDLHEIKKEREKEIQNTKNTREDQEDIENQIENSQTPSQEKKKQDLSKEEINKLIFGK